MGLETLGGSVAGSRLSFSGAGGSAAGFAAGLLAAAGSAGFDAGLLVAVGAASFLAAVGGATDFHPAGLDDGDVDNADNGSVFGDIMNKNSFQQDAYRPLVDRISQYPMGPAQLLPTGCRPPLDADSSWMQTPPREQNE